MQRYQDDSFGDMFDETWLLNPNKAIQIKSELLQIIGMLSMEDAFYFLQLIKLTTRSNSIDN
jgi:hypothetical protein